MSPRTVNAPRDMAAQRQRLRWSRLRRRVAPLLSKLSHLAVLSALCLSDLAGLAIPTPVRAADSSPPGLTQQISILHHKSFALQTSADLTATPEPTSLPFIPNPLPGNPVATPTATPVPPPAPEISLPITHPVVISRSLQLSLAANPPFITPGGNAFTDWSITGFDGLPADLSLIFQLPADG